MFVGHNFLRPFTYNKESIHDSSLTKNKESNKHLRGAKKKKESIRVTVTHLIN
ncbi:hypothetical protein BVRB_6g155930 [Beta vulgaris subsp. vulgaris]|uniref:Uncharacterized protein n=1 Tax=Beta vulgaris subsp. vulgaris TaxID=3555 RepID=A0A0J8E2M0_BETVV|nr:hypothetical protein BVRB_6g155930 [Beta vulgaris subsp. vulgaris]